MTSSETIAALQAQNSQLYNALAKMYLWQASEVNELLSDELADEVKKLLGEKMVDAIIDSEKDATFQDVCDDVKKRSCSHERLNMEGICFSCGHDCRGIG